MECDVSALLIIKDWARREFVTPGVDFSIVVVGWSETSLFRRMYFKIQYGDGEINEGTIFEARWDKKTGNATYEAFQTTGLTP